MTRAAFFVLTALADQPRHGYGILREVDDLSDGEVHLRVGTLYGVLDRLTADGLIVLDREEVQQGRLRRYYRLTDEGVAALDAEAERMAAGAGAAKRRIAAGRAGAPARPATGGQAGLEPPTTPGLAGGFA
ncbi:PadR family transcriptional regulator [Streptomyces sp. NRRL B-3648]|uniref:PadR family transcriptional regulator n=1 Tax=Streptomyces sp. NRRL B-3648 TaxID=1519493 RepID=UPI0006B01440|nr:PadR family transcriptional regulator [Streptomyces sp. NRRL B-3648]KOV92324.1 PadR family transcriptional regulator [Streptomyces sp. NRRL B-3648]